MRIHKRTLFAFVLVLILGGIVFAEEVLLRNSNVDLTRDEIATLNANGYDNMTVSSLFCDTERCMFTIFNDGLALRRIYLPRGYVTQGDYSDEELEQIYEEKGIDGLEDTLVFVNYTREELGNMIDSSIIRYLKNLVVELNSEPSIEEVGGGDIVVS